MTGPRKATTPRLTRKPPEPPTLVITNTVGLSFPVNRYRVLFSDGVTQDFLSYADHSGVRAQMLDAHFGPRPKDSQDKRIEGIAHLGQEYVYTPHPTTGTVTVDTRPANDHTPS